MKHVIGPVLLLAALAVAADGGFGSVPPGDISIVWVYGLPRDTVDTLTTFHLSVGVENYSAIRDSAFLVLVFLDTVRDRVVYRDSIFFRLQVGEQLVCNFEPVRFTVVGNHEGQFRLGSFYGGADTLEWPFWVVPGTGVEESLEPQASSPKPGQTILSGASGVRRLASSVVYDAMGRRVLDPRPGIYFVRDDGRGTKNESTRLRKVLVTR